MWKLTLLLVLPIVCLAQEGYSPPSVAPTGTAGGDLAGVYPNPTVRTFAVTTLPTAATATVGRIYRMTAATTANRCLNAGDSGGSAVAYCVSDGANYWALVAGTAAGAVPLPATATIATSLSITAPTATSQNGTSGTASCTQSLQGVLKVSNCYLNGYANTSTAQTYVYPTAFSTTPILLESGGSCGTYNPSTTATTLTLPANASMSAETCNVLATGQ